MAEKRGTNGNDTINNTGNWNPIYGLAGNDRITGAGFDDVIWGGDGRNGVTPGTGGVSDDDILDGQAGNDRLFGEKGNDSLYGGMGADYPDGGDGNDALFGGAGSDLLYGGAGNDTLDGAGPAAPGGAASPGGEIDIMTGGAGDDTYIVDNRNDQVIELASQGIDTVISSVTYSLTGLLPTLPTFQTENLTLAGTANIDATGNALANRIVGNEGNNVLNGGEGNDFLIGNGGNDSLVGGGGVDNLEGGVGNDTLDGGAGNDTLESGDGDDTMHGGAGNDLLTSRNGNDMMYGGDGNDDLRSGNGQDTMNGGAGNDTYRIDSNGDIVVEETDGGQDKIIAFSDITALQSRNVEVISAGSQGNLRFDTGSGAVSATGNAFDNTFEGGGEKKYYRGLAGNDVYYVRNSATTVVEEFSNGGNDTIYSDVTYTLPQGVENFHLIGDGQIDGTGSLSSDRIFGNSNSNTLKGLTGADELNGLGGDDRLFGDEGNDSLRGAEGNDTLEGGAGNDLLEGGAGNDILRGNAGKNTLDGGTGDDTYHVNSVDDIVIEDFDSGTDTVFTSVTLARPANIEAFFGVGVGNIDFETGSGDSTATGTEGDNVFDGETGVKTYKGLGGNDTYFVRSSQSVVIEAAGQGTDKVYAEVSTTLAENVEDLYLIGFGNIDGTGNDLGNRIEGNKSVNKLAGLAGNDRIVGGYGDILTGGAGSDVFQYDPSQTAFTGPGTMTIDDFKSGNGIENDVIDLGRSNAQDGMYVLGAPVGTAYGVQQFLDGSQVRIDVENTGDSQVDYSILASRNPYKADGLYTSDAFLGVKAYIAPTTPDPLPGNSSPVAPIYQVVPIPTYPGSFTLNLPAMDPGDNVRFLSIGQTTYPVPAVAGTPPAYFSSPVASGWVDPVTGAVNFESTGKLGTFSLPYIVVDALNQPSAAEIRFDFRAPDWTVIAGAKTYVNDIQGETLLQVLDDPGSATAGIDKGDLIHFISAIGDAEILPGASRPPTLLGANAFVARIESYDAANRTMHAVAGDADISLTLNYYQTGLRTGDTLDLDYGIGGNHLRWTIRDVPQEDYPTYSSVSGNTFSNPFSEILAKPDSTTDFGGALDVWYPVA